LLLVKQLLSDLWIEHQLRRRHLLVLQVHGLRRALLVLHGALLLEGKWLVLADHERGLVLLCTLLRVAGGLLLLPQDLAIPLQATHGLTVRDIPT
jgi:hypothetical protein